MGAAAKSEPAKASAARGEPAKASAPARSASARQLRSWLFPGCRTQADIEAAIRSETRATSTKLWRCARRLMEAVGTRDAADLYRRHRAVSAWIDGRRKSSDASKMTYYTALASIANPGKLSGRRLRVPAAVRRLYLERAAELSKRVKEEREKNMLDDHERASILPWPAILAAYRKNKGALDDTQAVLAALYLAGGDDPAGAPRRLDYNAVRVFRGKPPARPPKTLNYVVVRSGSDVELVLQEFKTSRHQGPYRARLPPAVSRVLTRSLRERPRRWLIHGPSMEPLTPSQLGKKLKATMAALTGRPIGASNLRKSFVTWLYSRAHPGRKHTMEEYALAMNHSPEEQLLYRRKHIHSVPRARLPTYSGGGWPYERAFPEVPPFDST